MLLLEKKPAVQAIFIGGGSELYTAGPQSNFIKKVVYF